MASTKVLMEDPILHSAVLPDELLVAAVFSTDDSKDEKDIRGVEDIGNYKEVFQNISPHLIKSNSDPEHIQPFFYSNHVKLSKTHWSMPLSMLASHASNHDPLLQITVPR